MRRALFSFINAVPHTITHESLSEPEINSLVFDSRQAVEGSLFFALPGTHTDGGKFIADAARAGAKAVVYQGILDSEADKVIRDAGITAARVEDARFAMSPIASSFFCEPSKKLVVIGVTGTEGKSSTVSFIWQLLRMRGKKVGFISTVQYSTGGGAIDNPQHQTTPEAPVVQELLARMADNGCEYAVVESSSHGLSPRTNRLGDVLFDAAVVMNVTHEHLEFHGTWEQYRNDKALLFSALSKHDHQKELRGKKTSIGAFGVVNADDPAASFFAQAAGSFPVIGFSALGKNDTMPLMRGVYSASNIDAAKEGISFNVRGGENSENENFFVNAPLPGAFNAYNVLAALITVSKLTETPPAILAECTKKLVPVRGRMTKISCGQMFEVIVDYAHTPSSFNAILPAIRVRAKGKVICVFGSGGERDMAKRPEQGKIAADYCDIVILADEDPRGENPVELLAMIESGCIARGKTRGKDVLIIPDRPTAVRAAFSLAHNDDIVLLLGKSHENSIIYKDRVMPYDEIAEAKAALDELLAKDKS
jgi:UDP-N-acetylmuramoyl-L-alanyl-D-glutamate--2,6-diaminopimelate ligase